MGSVLQKPETLKFTSTQVGLQATIYLIGAVLGLIILFLRRSISESPACC
ncbi:MAG TPA: hypothetical protein VGC06_05645 [Actinomycetes bacterium]